MWALVTTLLDILGLALIVAGFALWSIPAALIVAGIAVILVSWQVSR